MLAWFVREALLATEWHAVALRCTTVCLAGTGVVSVQELDLSTKLDKKQEKTKNDWKRHQFFRRYYTYL